MKKFLVAVVALVVLAGVVHADPGALTLGRSVSSSLVGQVPAPAFGFGVGLIAAKPLTNNEGSDFSGGLSLQVGRFRPSWPIVGGHWGNVDLLASTNDASRGYVGGSLSVSKTANDWIVGVKAIGGGPITWYTGYRTNIASF